ncbi:multidrug resistance efflux transporter family protein [Peribacillus sp. FSL H8-0477]|uniref:DMT family transporter n=1 Tax=Peribacillus sp. FSL H8-0477 TaxID=2921388 RepID=UPI0030F5AD64
MKPIILGICSAFFFSITFILNRSMELSGGSWLWSSSLRYFFMVPFLLCIVLARKNLRPLFGMMRERWGSWILWSTVGFGLFYAPLCFAAAYAPGWLTASTWLISIISGSLLAPLFFVTAGGKTVRGKIPFRGLTFSVLILAGIVLMQIEHAGHISRIEAALGFIPVLIASFAYPLGNRKMMELCGGKLDVFQRVLGMTIASLPFWLVLSVFGILKAGLPSAGQTFQSLLVAISSGVIATVLFFKATDLVRGNMTKLAAVEATQSMEVLFTVFGELLIVSTLFPSLLSWIGMIIIMVGMVLHSYFSQRMNRKLGVQL